MGGMSLSHGINDDTNIVDLVSKYEQETDNKISYIFVDEVQFFSTDQIEQLVHLADVQDIDIFAYGLLTSYKGELFTASKRLIELCDRIVQISNGMRCWCGARATHNALYLSGRSANTGSDTIVDNADNIDYRVMCRRHFLEHTGNHSKRDLNG
jgi:thymidine kinase